jgi:superfamily II DNA helicase RecQ
LPSEKELNDEGRLIYEALKQWRFDKASVLGLPAYLISSNGELITIAKVKPQTIDELAAIKGFGGQKIAKYGEEILALLNSVA